MDIKKFEKLYHRLFEIAWNSDFIDNLQDEKNRKAALIATDLYNDYNLKSYYPSQVSAINASFNTPIGCHRARTEYYCSSNKDHCIKKGDQYGRILVDGNPRSGSILCVSCLAKILIIVLTKFPPSSDPVEYKTIADDFDPDLIE